jgi:hypothetical protein
VAVIRELCLASSTRADLPCRRVQPRARRAARAAGYCSPADVRWESMESAYPSSPTSRAVTLHAVLIAVYPERSEKPIRPSVAQP